MSPLSPQSRPRLAAKARLKWDRHQKKHMILYPERGLVLSESAAAIVLLCDGARTIAEIAQTLAERANGTAPRSLIAEEVLHFVEAMEKKGVLSLVAP